MTSASSWNRRRLLRAGALLALLAAAGLWLFLRRPAAAPPEPPWRILRDDDALIEEAVCVVNSARRALLRNAALVTTVVNALPSRTRVTILTNDPRAFVVARNPNPQRVRLLDLPADSAFTIWPQDPFVVLAHKDGRRILLESAAFERADDRLLAQRLAEGLRCERRTSRWVLEGGNIVVGARHAFVGANTVRHNAVRSNVPEEQVVGGFQEEFGRPVLVLGPVPQPIGHIDMAVTPLDARRLMVADPGWGARLAREQLAGNPQAVDQFERSCQEHYFGDPRITVLYDHEGRPIARPKVAGQTAEAAADTQRIAADLDKLAEELARRGYQVLRVPFLFRPIEEEAATRPAGAPTTKSATAPATAPTTKPTTNPTTKPAGRAKAYPCLTYNNVLMEVDGTGRTVYLPQYGWPAFDQAGVKAWQDAGYRVVRVEGFAVSSMYGGSLRCCVKVLKRATP